MTLAYPGKPATGYAVSVRGNFEKTYRAALRHSRQVRWLRILVPTGIALLLLSVIAANYLPPVGGFRLPGELGKLVIHGTKIEMQQPRLTGYTTDSRAYEFSADAAAQDVTKPDLVELHKLHAKMEMEDKSTVEMTAAGGIYDIKAEVLTLQDDILLSSTSGYAGQLSEAVIDVKRGNVVSSKPVRLKMLDGELNAQRLEIGEKGDVIRFTDVALTLQPGRNGPAAAGVGAPAAAPAPAAPTAATSKAGEQ